MSRVIILVLMLYCLSSKAQLNVVPSGVFHWSDIPVVKSADREGRKFVEGKTSELSYLEIHASTQYKGAQPRAPHALEDIEEIIFVKEGLMKFTLDTNSKVLGKGSLVLIPPHVKQSVQNVGDGALTYYVIGYRSKKPMDMDRSAKAGGPLMLNADSVKFVPTPRGGGVKYINRPTAMLDNLEMHITQLNTKGPAHVLHTHVDTELTIVLEGDTEMEIAGKHFTASEGDIYLMDSNELHGIGNPKNATIKYLAIRLK